MKTSEVKNFYGTDKLNKGFSEEEAKLHIKASANSLKEHLPESGIFAAYEEIKPGTIEKILEIAKEEQKRKIKLDEAALNINEKIQKLGVVSGLLALVIICATTYKIAMIDINSGLIFSGMSFLAIFSVSITSYLTKNITNRSVSHSRDFPKRDFTKKFDKKVIDVVETANNNSTETKFVKSANKKFRRRK
jgi:uncharacterized membrane protein